MRGYQKGILCKYDSGFGKFLYSFVASGAGGVEIEETAAENPDSIIRRNIDINIGVRDYFLRNIASMLGG